MWQDRAGSSWVIFRARGPLAPPKAVLPQQTPGTGCQHPPFPWEGASLCGSTPGAYKGAENSKLRAENSREGVNLGDQIDLGVPEAVCVISFGTQVWAVPLAGPRQRLVLH